MQPPVRLPRYSTAAILLGWALACCDTPASRQAPPGSGAEPGNSTDTGADGDTESGTDSGNGTADGDGDGYAAADDCDDDDPDVYPGSPALCEERTCGWDFCGGLCGGVSCASGPTTNTVLQIVGSWYVPSTSNALLVEDPDESPAGADFRGQLFYAADDTSGGDVPLYRLHHSAPGQDDDDHMVSTDPGEGAPDYALEAELALGWSSEREGTEQLHRYLSADPYDHDAGFPSDPPSGYDAEGGLAWVYPRYGLADEVITTVAGAEVELGVNAVAGGAAWSLRWGGVEFLSAYDFGRQLQIALQANGVGEADNPTEAGDAHAAPGDPDGWRHGSPVLELTTGPGSVYTRTRPLQWLPEGFHTGAHDPARNPVAWNGSFEKEITLDYGGNPHILAWTTRITLPEPQGSLNIELATGYLTGAFDTFYTYDASTGLLVDKTAGIPAMGCVDPSEDPDQQAPAGGVIVATSSGSHAMGVYRDRSLNAVEGYGLCSFLDGDTDPHAFSTSKWNLLERPSGGLDAGTYAWGFFLVVGTLEDCVAAMDELYAAR